MASRRKTSVLWNHFVEDKDFKRGKCNYCSEIISFTSGSLGNLNRHLKRKHPTICDAPVERENIPIDAKAEFVNLPTESEPFISDELPSSASSAPRSTVHAEKRVVQSKIDGFTQRPLPQSKKLILDRQLVNMIAKEYHPLNIVNDPEFKKFVGLLNPSYNLPTRKTLSESLLPQIYMQLKEQVKNQILKASAVCITTDSWTSDNNESFIGITAHYIDPHVGQLCANLIGCIEYNESHTAANLCHFLKDELNKWQLHNKVGVVVSDNAVNILAAVQLGEWRSVSCFAHTLNLVVQAGIEKISSTINRVKKIVEYFHRSTAALNKLKSIQKQMNLQQLKLKQDVSTRWNSTYDMLVRVIKIKEALIATLALVKTDLALSNEDWTVIEKSIPLLKIFYEVTVEISTEKSVSLSKVIVYCRLLKSQITLLLTQAETTQESGAILTLLKTIERQFQDRFHSIESNVLYAESTILDPRFKNKGFRDETNYHRALASLKRRVGGMRTTAPEPTSCTSVTQPLPTPSTSKGSSIWNDFDQEIACLVPENTTAAGIVELDKYIQEPIINRLEDPLLWWFTRRSVYPLLYQYILKRLNIVATSVPCERIFSKAGLTLSSRRRRLKASKLSMLLFIGSNQK